MSVKDLDFIFPFIIFGYGLIVTFVLMNPRLVRLAEEKLPSDLWQQFQSKRPLAFLCLVVGAAWSLQNIWLG